MEKLNLANNGGLNWVAPIINSCENNASTLANTKILQTSHQIFSESDGMGGRYIQSNRIENLNLNEYQAPGESQFPIGGCDVIGRVFLTKNDGSCGLHSIFGEYDPKKATFVLENVQQKREEIANWVEDSFNKKNVPPLMIASLESYIQNPTDAPSYIKDMLTYLKTGVTSDRINNILHRYGMDLTNKALTKDNPLLIAAFVRHFKEVSSFLSLEEITAIARQYEKSISIYTKFVDELILSNVDDLDADSTVDVCFDPETKHFSKMLKKNPDQKLKEIPLQFQVKIESKEEKEKADLVFARLIDNLDQSVRMPIEGMGSDLNYAESLQRQFDLEQQEKIAREKADFLLAQSLERETGASLKVDGLEKLYSSSVAAVSHLPILKEDLKVFFNLDIKKNLALLNVALLNTIYRLRSNQAVSSILKEALLGFETFRSTLNTPLHEVTLKVNKTILFSPEWKDAYIEHLMSGSDFSPKDLDVINAIKEEKEKAATGLLSSNPKSGTGSVLVESSKTNDGVDDLKPIAEKADFLLAQSLESETGASLKVDGLEKLYSPSAAAVSHLPVLQKDLEVFFNLKKKENLTLLNLALLNTMYRLRSEEAVSSKLKEALLGFETFRSTLNTPLHEVTLCNKSILSSPKWKDAYIEHLMSDSDFSRNDLDVINAIKKEKLQKDLEVFFNLKKKENRTLLNLALLNTMYRLRSNQAVSSILKEALLGFETFRSTLNTPLHGVTLKVNKTILFSPEWKDAYIEHLMSGSDFSQNDLDVINAIKKEKEIENSIT